MIRAVRYVTLSFETIREDHKLDVNGAFLGSIGGLDAVVPTGLAWLVDRIYYRWAGATGGVVRLYESPEVSSIYLADAVDTFVLPPGSTYPLENTADEVQPPIVREGKRFILDARGGDANARIFIRVEYRIATLQQIWVPEEIGTMHGEGSPSSNGAPGASARAPAVSSRRPFSSDQL